MVIIYELYFGTKIDSIKNLYIEKINSFILFKSILILT
jgi:hypothetical protein